MPTTRAKRAGYREAVQWIAHNDEPGEHDVETMADLVSVLLVADLFGKPADEVARDVVRAREHDERAAHAYLRTAH
jgi:hypothetical protein